MYRNVLASFERTPVAIAYVIANMALGIPAAGGYEPVIPADTERFWMTVAGTDPDVAETLQYQTAYLARFPALDRPERALDLLREEHRLRHAGQHRRNPEVAGEQDVGPAAAHGAPGGERQVRTRVVHAVQHLCFVTFGAAVWMPLFGPLPKPTWFTNAWALGYVLLVRFVGAAPSEALALPGAFRAARAYPRMRWQNHQRWPSGSFTPYSL